ncbi:MAG: recombination mediator RecR [Bacteroidales bacterium]
MNKLLEDACEQFSTLPGVGGKTAMRLALHMLKQPRENVDNFANAIVKLRHNIKYCRECNLICDSDLCEICANPKRDHSIICVVENVREVLSIEDTQEYNGIYHVLGGIISPMDGIGPDDLPIPKLIDRAFRDTTKEIILALSTSVEGETTSFYLYRLLEKTGVKVTTIARGVGFGDDLEYTDSLTLGRSITHRQEFSPEL